MKKRMEKTYQPDDPAPSPLYQRIYSSFSKQNFLATIGARLESVEPGKVVISAERKESLLQQQGRIHGGVLTTLADVTGGYCALTTLPEGYEVLSVEIKINFLRSTESPVIRATGTVVKAGRTLVIVESTVRDDGGVEIAKMQGTMIAVPPKKAAEKAE